MVPKVKQTMQELLEVIKNILSSPPTIKKSFNLIPKLIKYTNGGTKGTYI